MTFALWFACGSEHVSPMFSRLRESACVSHARGRKRRKGDSVKCPKMHKS